MVGGYDIAVRERGIKYSLPARLQNKLLSANKNLISEKISRPWDIILLPSVSAGQSDLLDVTITSPLQPSLNSDAPRRYGFALTNAEMKYEIYTQKCAWMGIQFLPLVFVSFGGFSELIRKTFNRIALLADNQKFQPAGLSIARNRLSLGVSVTLMRGSAKMLTARNPLLWDSFIWQHSQLHKV